MLKSFMAGLFLNALVGFLQFFHIVPVISRFGTVYTGFYGGYNTLEILLVLGMMIGSPGPIKTFGVLAKSIGSFGMSFVKPETLILSLSRMCS